MWNLTFCHNNYYTAKYVFLLERPTLPGIFDTKSKDSIQDKHLRIVLKASDQQKRTAIV